METARKMEKLKMPPNPKPIFHDPNGPPSFAKAHDQSMMEKFGGIQHQTPFPNIPTVTTTAQSKSPAKQQPSITTLLGKVTVKHSTNEAGQTITARKSDAPFRKWGPNKLGQ